MEPITSDKFITDAIKTIRKGGRPYRYGIRGSGPYQATVSFIYDDGATRDIETMRVWGEDDTALLIAEALFKESKKALEKWEKTK